jgi:hypothetical protein
MLHHCNSPRHFDFGKSANRASRSRVATLAFITGTLGFDAISVVLRTFSFQDLSNHVGNVTQKID